MQFNQMVTDNLKAYVYALADPTQEGPLKDRVFYIGKGRGNRCFNHTKMVRKMGEEPLDEKEHKLARIREIRDANRDVEVHVVDHGLSDKEAHKLEAVLIRLLGETNRTSGHGDRNFWLTRNQINEAYDRPIEREDFSLFRGNILFVSLNKQDTDSLLQSGSEDKLARATMGNWVVSEAKSARVDCVVGVKYGLVVSIFETLKKSDRTTQFVRIEREKKRARERSRFAGIRRLDLEQDLRGRSVRHNQKELSKIRPQAGCEFYEAMT